MHGRNEKMNQCRLRVSVVKLLLFGAEGFDWVKL
jgi:hypothetical protein